MKTKKELVNALIASEIGTHELDYDYNDRYELISVIVMDNHGGEARLSRDSVDKDQGFVEPADYYDDFNNVCEVEGDVLFDLDMKESYQKLLESDPVNRNNSQFRAEALLKIRELDGEYNYVANNLK